MCNAASKANAPLVRALCQSGIDVNCADYDGRTCIHLAASDGVFVIVQVWLPLPLAIYKSNAKKKLKSMNSPTRLAELRRRAVGCRSNWSSRRMST